MAVTPTWGGLVVLPGATTVLVKLPWEHVGAITDENGELLVHDSHVLTQDSPSQQIQVDPKW